MMKHFYCLILLIDENKTFFGVLIYSNFYFRSKKITRLKYTLIDRSFLGWQLLLLVHFYFVTFFFHIYCTKYKSLLEI